MPEQNEQPYRPLIDNVSHIKNPLDLQGTHAMPLPPKKPEYKMDLKTKIAAGVAVIASTLGIGATAVKSYQQHFDIPTYSDVSKQPTPQVSEYNKNIDNSNNFPQTNNPQARR